MIFKIAHSYFLIQVTDLELTFQKRHLKIEKKTHCNIYQKEIFYF